MRGLIRTRHHFPRRLPQVCNEAKCLRDRCVNGILDLVAFSNWLEPNPVPPAATSTIPHSTHTAPRLTNGVTEVKEEDDDTTMSHVRQEQQEESREAVTEVWLEDDEVEVNLSVDPAVDKWVRASVIE